MPAPQSKLREPVIQRLEKAIEMGATYELACKYAGIGYTTMREWVKRGEAEIERLEKPRTKPKASEADYVTFVERLRAAEGEAAHTWLAAIESAALSGQWQAAAWKLERRYPESYGRQKVDVDVTSDGKPISFIEVVRPDNDSK